MSLCVFVFASWCLCHVLVSRITEEEVYADVCQMSPHKPGLREVPVAVPPLVPPTFLLSHLGVVSKMRILGEHFETVASVSQIVDKPPSSCSVSLLSGGREQGCTVHCAASPG